MPWIYDPGQKRKKHKWQKDYAGFENEGGTRVGKCSMKVTPEVAAELLNTGVEWNNPYLPKSYPHNIYNGHDGVIYKAAITLHGVSYHGFPCEGSVPKEILARLRMMAAEKNCSEAFEEWVTRYIR